MKVGIWGNLGPLEALLIWSGSAAGRGRLAAARQRSWLVMVCLFCLSVAG